MIYQRKYRKKKKATGEIPWLLLYSGYIPELRISTFSMLPTNIL